MPDASSSAPGASASGSITEEGIESKCPETRKTVFASFGSLPGRNASTFSRRAGLSFVRGAVASKRSTATDNFPPDARAISVRRATILSRPHPMPRLESSQDESEWRVPQAASSSTVARSAFSSTEWRGIAPPGGGRLLPAGFPAGGLGRVLRGEKGGGEPCRDREFDCRGSLC